MKNLKRSNCGTTNSKFLLLSNKEKSEDVRRQNERVMQKVCYEYCITRLLGREIKGKISKMRASERIIVILRGESNLLPILETESLYD